MTPQYLPHAYPLLVLDIDSLKAFRGLKLAVDESKGVEVVWVELELVLVQVGLEQERERLLAELTHVGRPLDQLLTDVATFGG